MSQESCTQCLAHTMVGLEIGFKLVRETLNGKIEEYKVEFIYLTSFSHMPMNK